MSKPLAIHLIERIGNFTLIDKSTWTFESCCWALADETAKSLIGSLVYFHKAQDEPSYYGGEIINCKKSSDRFIIVFQFKASARNVKAGANGWGMEKKITY